MNDEHFQAWLHELRTTNKPQAKGKLKGLADELGSHVVGYCCLGLGCELAGIAQESGEFNTLYHFGEVGHVSLAPIEFMEWLGLDVPPPQNPLNGYDLYADIPRESYRDECGNMTAAEMNDMGFTFSQIADVFEYFGVREQVTADA